MVCEDGAWIETNSTMDCSEFGGLKVLPYWETSILYSFKYCAMDEPWMCDNDNCGVRNNSRCCSNNPKCKNLGGLIDICSNQAGTMQVVDQAVYTSGDVSVHKASNSRKHGPVSHTVTSNLKNVMQRQFGSSRVVCGESPHSPNWLYFTTCNSYSLTE